MIRHARLEPAAIAPLAIAMIEPSFGALLVTAIGEASLADPCLPPAGEAAIALAAIATSAQKELAAAFAVPANPPSEALARGRHAHWQAALDNGSSFVAGWNQLVCGDLTKVALPEPRRVNGGVPLLPPSKLTLQRNTAARLIGQMFAPPARMMLPPTQKTTFSDD